jgi:hypothetical protein
MKTTYLLTQLGFAAITFVYFWLFLRQLHKSLKATGFPEKRKNRILRGTTLALIGWAVLTGILSLSGFFSDFSSFPPNIMIVLIVPLTTIIWMVSTKTTKEILLHTPAETIIGLQSFRVFVEILLWMLFITNLAPIQMTFEGRNLDILSGITAPLIAFLVYRKKLSRTLTIVWNIACLGLLANIVITAILSMPTPFRVFMNDPSNTIVTEFPIIWLPALLVPLAYGLHFLSIRQLLTDDVKQ